MVYLDYAAATPVLPEVLDSYNKVTEDYFANPESLHSFGIKSKELLEQTFNVCPQAHYSVIISLEKHFNKEN